ncbi:LytR/AlgR family response regulator transcription factor [Dethiothermospora halolimnae]|uniref:LytR/AlgR family response regulator transcription factor n=1 Tax=Dethiothermospora halolimnae TaxID=3114390 RepID=UPI003CCBACE9
MISILICDDDIYTLRVLKKVIEENDSVKDIFMANNGEEALEIIKTYEVHLAFLDIDMPKMDGLEAAKIMKTINKDIEIVFITAFRHYALDSYEIRAFDYILKPIDFSRVKEDLQKILDKINEKGMTASLKDNDIIVIKNNEDYQIINMNEINYFEKDKKQLIIHTPNNRYITNMGLKEIEEKLSSAFLRTHKSYIVNLKNIHRISPYGTSSFIIFFKNTDENDNALITKNKIKFLKT